MVRKVSNVVRARQNNESGSASPKQEKEPEKKIASIGSSKNRTAKELETNALSDFRVTPFYVRFHLVLILGVALSVGWLWLSLNYINAQIPFSDLGALLPHEVGGMAAGTLTPLALLWMVIAFFVKNEKFTREARQLSWQMRQLATPSSASQKRMHEITDSLRRQARDLSKASEEAATRAQKVSQQVQRRTLQLSKVSEDADLRAQAIAESLRRQSEDLNTVTSNAAHRAEEVGEIIYKNSQEIVNTSERASTRVEDISELLRKRNDELLSTSNDVLEKVSLAANNFRERVKEIRSMSVDSLSLAGDIHESLDSRLSELLTTSDEAARKVQASSDILHSHSQDCLWLRPCC